jgi:hypothetical protein
MAQNQLSLDCVCSFTSLRRKKEEVIYVHEKKAPTGDDDICLSD